MSLHSDRKFCLFKEEEDFEEVLEEEEWLDDENGERGKTSKNKSAEDPIRIYFKHTGSLKFK